MKEVKRYAIRKWLYERGMGGKGFSIDMDGRVALVTDVNGNTTILEYDRKSKEVYQIG